MSSTADSGHPPAVIEKPVLDHISTDPPEDSHTDSENPSKLKNAKNIGTTTPEVEGEENEPVAAVEDYPSTPVSTMDSKFQPLPLTAETKEDSAPLPPTPEETEFDVSKEAEATKTEEKQLDDAEESKGEGKEGSDKIRDGADFESSGVKEEVGETSEKPESPGLPETKEESSEDKNVELKPEGRSSEPPVEKVDEQPIDTPETISSNTHGSEATNEQPSKDRSEEGEEKLATVDDQTPTALDASSFGTEVLKTAEPVEEAGGAVTETEVEDQEHAETQTAPGSQPNVDEPKAEEFETTADDHESPVQASSEEPREKTKPTPSPKNNTTEITEDSRSTELEAKDSAAEDIPEPVVPSEPNETVVDEAMPETSEGAGAEPEKETPPLDEVLEAVEEVKEEATEKQEPEPAGAEPPSVDVLPLTEPPTEKVKVSSVDAKAIPEPSSTKESEEDVKEESELATTEPVETERQVLDIVPETEHLKVGVGSLSVRDEDKSKSEPAEEPKEGMKEESQPETVETTESVEVDPAVVDALPATELLKEVDVPLVATEAKPDPGPVKESLEEKNEEVLKGELPLEGLVEVPEEPEEPEETTEVAGGLVEEVEEEPGSDDLRVQGETQETPQAIPAVDEVKPEEPEQKPVEEEGAKQEVAVEETHAEEIVASAFETETGEGAAADPGNGEVGEEGERAVPQPRSEEPVLETPVEEENPSEPVVPTVVVEKTAENQPSHGEDLGPNATEGQKEAFELRKSDSEPDEVIVREEPPRPEAVLAGENTFESTPVQAEAETEASTEPGVVEAESTPKSEVDDKAEDLEQDEPVVISHDDAPLEEVEKAEAAIEQPSLEHQEGTVEAPKETEAKRAEDLETAVSLERKDDSKHEVKASLVEVLAAVAEESAIPEKDTKDLPEEYSTDSVPEAKLEESKIGNTEALAVSEEIKQKVEPSTALNEPRETPIAEEITHAPEPVEEVPQETSADPAAASDTKLDQGSHENAGTSRPTAPEDSRKVVEEEASMEPHEMLEKPEKPQEEAQEFSVSSLPASPTIGNPTDLAPGENIPEDFKVSTGGITKIDKKPFGTVNDQLEGTLSPATRGDTKSSMRPEVPVETQPEEQIFSVNPLPDSKTFGNPIDLQPGEPIPAYLTEASGADSVKLDEEPFKKQVDTAPVADEVKTEESDDDTGKKILAAGASPVATFTSDPKVGNFGAPTIDKAAKVAPPPAQEQVLPVELSPTRPAVQKESSESLVASTSHPTDKSVEGIIKPSGTEIPSNIIDSKAEVLDRGPLQASAVDVPDEGMVAQPVPDRSGEAISEPAPQSAPSPAHDVVVPEENVPQVLKGMEASGAPAIVVSGPSTEPRTEIIQPSSSEVVFDEAAANKARESENTPDGVRKRRIPGGDASRPTSSGTDAISAKHQNNLMKSFWHMLSFGWLGGFGRFFGGMFSRSKSKKRK